MFADLLFLTKLLSIKYIKLNIYKHIDVCFIIRCIFQKLFSEVNILNDVFVKYALINFLLHHEYTISVYLLSIKISINVSSSLKGKILSVLLRILLPFFFVQCEFFLPCISSIDPFAKQLARF